MTTDVGGYQPPENTTYSPPPLTVGDERQTPGRDAAREESGSAVQGAKEAGSQIASTAGEQTKQVAGEAKYQVRNLANEAGAQAKEQANIQKERATSGLRSISGELQAMAENGGQSGVATDLARQGSQAASDLAGWLDAREPGQLLDEVRGLARRKPGAFLIGCVAAGVVAGRLTRGAVAAAKSDDADDQEPGSAWQDATATTATVQPTTDASPLAPENEPGRHVTEPDPLTAPLTLEDEQRQAGSYGFVSGESR